MQYRYRAKKLSGEVIEGVLEADNQRLVISKLQQMQVFPFLSRSRAVPVWSGIESQLVAPGFRRMSPHSAVSGDLLKAGLPLVRCLDVITQQTSNPKMVEVVKAVSSDVHGGTTIADAMAKHPRVFPPLYSSMVRAGEVGGMLDAVMERLAQFLEAEQETRSKIISAMTYPAFMVIVCVFVMIILFTVVVPNFMVMFEESEIELPISTFILLEFSEFIRDWWWIMVLGIVGNCHAAPVYQHRCGQDSV